MAGGTVKEWTELSWGFRMVGGLTDCTQPGSGLEWRPPALAGLKSLLGVAGGRCTLLSQQVLVAGSVSSSLEMLVTTTVKASRAFLSIGPTLHRRQEKARIFYGRLSRIN